MAATRVHVPFLLPLRRRGSLHSRRSYCFRCSSSAQGGDDNDRDSSDNAPPLLKVAVSAVTELLRLVSPGSYRVENYSDEEPAVVGCVDDVVAVLESDYERAYFLTGDFTSDVYSEDCLFEDPTISFRGKKQYLRNLKLLVPFFRHPSLTLEKIEKCANDDSEFILAAWKLRTYLNLPWRPLISINGTTKYGLNSKLKITRHSEFWSISALEAVGQIFSPSWKEEE